MYTMKYIWINNIHMNMWSKCSLSSSKIGLFMNISSMKICYMNTFHESQNKTKITNKVQNMIHLILHHFHGDLYLIMIWAWNENIEKNIAKTKTSGPSDFSERYGTLFGHNETSNQFLVIGYWTPAVFLWF